MGTQSVVLGTLRAFGRETSIPGLNNAGRAKSYLRCLLWLVVFAGLLYLTVEGFVFVVCDFLSHPYATSTSLSYQPSVQFPSVTVCNHNRYSAF